MNEDRPRGRWAQVEPKGVGDVLAGAWGELRRFKWPLLVASLVVVAATVLVVLSPVRQVWTASALLEVGSMPRAVRLEMTAGALTEPIEDARVTLARLGNPVLLNAVRAHVKPVSGGDGRVAAVPPLRGQLIAERVIRIEVTAPTGADARALASATIEHISQVHAQILAKRVALLDAMAASAGSTDALLSKAAVATAKSAAEPTRIMYGTEVTVSEPVNLRRNLAPLLAGLATLAAAVLLTLAVTARRDR